MRVCHTGLQRKIHLDHLGQLDGHEITVKRADCHGMLELVQRKASFPCKICRLGQCKTSAANVFAVGDVTGAPMLAHRATHQGKIAAEVSCGHNAFFDTDIIPAVAYTDPEMAWAGILPHQAKAQNIDHQISEFPWAASGRNLTSDAKPGLTRLVWHRPSKRLIGASIIGSHAGELLAELVLAIEMGATIDDLALTIHAHPTLSETTAFAAELAAGTCIDF